MRLFLALVACSICLLTTSPTFCETLEPDSSIARYDKFDAAVPDAPAFKLLDVDPNSILRPGTRREVAISLQSATLKSFAIECAPFLLARDGQIPLSKYRSLRFLYNVRVSAGTRLLESGQRGAGVGIRFSFHDSGDPYMSADLIGAAVQAGKVIQEARGRAQNQYLHDHPRQTALGFAGLPDSVRETRLKPYWAKQRDEAEQQYEQVKRRFDQEWHRDILELAFAASGSSSDSTGGPFRATGYAGWFTGGGRLGRNGQILVGVNGGVVSDSLSGRLDKPTGAAAIRLYYGSKVAKAAVSGDVGWSRRTEPKLAGALGAEARLMENLWVDANVGLKRERSGQTNVVPALQVRYAIAGKFPSQTLMGE